MHIDRTNGRNQVNDANGELVGINADIVSPTGGSVGIGFAIPVNTAKVVLDQIVAYGRVIRGWLGAEYADVASLQNPAATHGVAVIGVYPNGAAHLVAFDLDPWPTWHFELPDGTRVLQEIFVEHRAGVSIVEWTLVRAAGHVGLRVRPFLSGRDYHAMHHENAAFRFTADAADATVAFQPYARVRVLRQPHAASLSALRHHGVAES